MVVARPGETLILEPPETGAGVEAALGGGLLRPLPGGTLTVPAELGDHWLATASRDAAGNLSEVRWLLLRVALPPDDRPPRARASLEGLKVRVNGDLVVSPRARLDLEMEDGESGPGGWRVLMDGAEVEEGAWRGGWPPGPHTVEARAVDRAGNETSVPPLRFVVDDAPPRLTWEVVGGREVDCAAGAAGGGEVTVTARAEDALTAVEWLAWSVGDRVWRAVPQEGVRATGGPLLLLAQDKVGNETRARICWQADAGTEDEP